MKIIKKVFIFCLALFLVLAVAAVIFIKTFNVMRYKPQIVEAVSKALGRQVDFAQAKLDVSLTQGIIITLNNLAVKEDPAFGAADFLTAKDVSLGVDVLAYISQKKISVPRVFVDSPQITIIRSKDGKLNVSTMARASQNTLENFSSGTRPILGVGIAYAAGPVKIPEFLVSSLKVVNGTLKYIDRAFEPAISVDVTNLDLSASGISLDRVFPFVIEAALFSGQRNIKVEGKAKIDPATNQLTLSDLRTGADLSALRLDKIAASLPMVKGDALPTALKGKLDIKLDTLSAGPQGLSGISGDATLKDGMVQLRQLASSIKDILANAMITSQSVKISNASLGIGGGSIKASGIIDDYLAKQDFNLEAVVNNLALQEIIVQDKSPVKVEGLASGEIKVKGTGFTQAALQSSLSGKADLSFSKLKLKDINILRTVLDKISVIPGLSEKMEKNLPDRFKQKLTQKDTVLLDVKLPITIENGQFIINDTVITADEFMLKGQGRGGFDGSYVFEGAFLIPQELSASMVTSVKELQYLLNNENQIYIPVKITGIAGSPNFSVDAEYMAKKILVEQGEKQLFKALDKAFKKKGAPPADNSNP